MGVAQLDEEVVQVGLVGTEGGLAPYDAGTHHAEGVEDGDAQYGKGEGYESEVGTYSLFDGLEEHGDDEIGEDDAQGQGAGVADEHLGAFAEHVVQEEGQQGYGNDGGQCQHVEVAYGVEHRSEEDGTYDAIAGGVAIDAVDEVDGIDDTYCGKDGEGHRQVAGYLIQAPQAMEVVELIAGGVDEEQYQDDFYDETHARRQGDGVVEKADDMDDDDGCEHGKEGVVLAEEADGHHPCHDSKDYGESAQHGDGHALQFTCIGTVHNLLFHCHLEDIRMYPGRNE